MTASALFAFLHHVAAFTLFGTLLIELALFERNLTFRLARKIQRADLAYGIAAGTVLVAGLLRVFYFEKGGAYYFHNVFFLLKLSLFVTIALLSLYPTILFLSWKKRLKSGLLPELTDAHVRRVRATIFCEVLGIVAILLCAPLMARGMG
jgi:putative membrane protein